MVKLLVLVGSVLTMLLLAGWLQSGCACTPKWRAYAMAARSDLRVLVDVQDSLFAENLRFARDVPPVRNWPSTGVRVEIIEATDSGWRAIARHEAIEGECRIHVGKVAARPVTEGDTLAAEGAPACWGTWPREPSIPLRWRLLTGQTERPRPAPPDSVTAQPWITP